MVTDALLAMGTDLLILAQWFSPASPVGAFAYSHGLEAAVARGDVAVESLPDWLSDVLDRGAGRSDALLLAAAYGADDIPAVDAIARAFAPSRERLQETCEQGAAFCRMIADVWGHHMGHLTLPVAAGRAAQLADLSLIDTIEMYLHCFVGNLVAAAQRLVPLGQTQAQTILKDLAPRILEVAQDSRHGDLDHLTGTAFLTDIAAMHHETQNPRIFRT